MGFKSGPGGLVTGLEVDSDSDIKLDASTGNIILQDAGTDKLSFDLDSVANTVIMQLATNDNSDSVQFRSHNTAHDATVINAGWLDSGGYGGFFHKKAVYTADHDNEGAGSSGDGLNLSSVANAMRYSGGIILIDMHASAAFPITLPTATSDAEANQLMGWNVRIILNTAQSSNTNDVTIVRGDAAGAGAGNDFIFGLINVHDGGGATPGGITTTTGNNGAEVLTFVAGTAVVGDYIDITCVAANASMTKYLYQAHCVT